MSASLHELAVTDNVMVIEVIKPRYMLIKFALSL